MSRDPTPEDTEGRGALDELRHRTHEGLHTARVHAQARAKLFGETAEPTRIGRYLIARRIGAGGMGVVYRAHDPELDRAVAIKLLRSDDGGDADVRRQARLLLEAQALAKLSHPNVIDVYDVGTHEGQVYLAMELVQGTTLLEWLEGERPWQKVLSTFTRAGRGLEAAHAAGLIHRDFKPTNVLVGDDGRVHVVDFGLARTVGQAIDHGYPASAATPEHTPLTQTGALMGTPAYMAPERFAGAPADELSDQFSFCVSLYQGLFGQLPFAGQSIPELADNISHGRIEDSEGGGRVPSRVRASVVRGLEVDPRRRFGSMTELLSAMDHERRWVRRLGVVAAGGGLLAGAWVVGTSPDTPQCAGAEQLIQTTWNEDQRRAIARTFDSAQVGFADDSRQRVESRLDEYVRQWTAERIDACEDTQHRGQSEELLDLRIACLDRALTRVRALVAALAETDADGIEGAIQATGSLPPLRRCGDVEFVTAGVRPPEDPEVAAQVAVLTERLAEVEALRGLRQHESARALVQEVVADAEELGYEPLIAEGLSRRGMIANRVGRRDVAIPDFERAFFLARAAGDDAVEARAAIALMRALGLGRRKMAPARQWAQHAQGALDRSGVAERDRVDFLIALGALEEVEGNAAQALEHNLEALRIIETLPGVPGDEVAGVLGEIGIAYDTLGKYAEALDYLLRGYEMAVESLGPDHPDLIPMLGNIALDYEEIGDYQASLTFSRRALQTAERAYGRVHPDVAVAELNYAVALDSAGDLDAATAALQRSLAITTEVHGTGHPDVPLILSNLGVTSERSGDYARAVLFHERAIATAIPLHGADHPDVALYRTNAGATLIQLSRFEEAHAELEAAISSYEATFGPSHPKLAFTLLSLGDSLIREQRPAEAIAYLERAVAIRSRDDIDARYLAQSKSMLANALWHSGRDRGRALELKREAVEQLRGSPSEAKRLEQATEALAQWEATIRRGR